MDQSGTGDISHTEDGSQPRDRQEMGLNAKEWKLLYECLMYNHNFNATQ